MKIIIRSVLIIFTGIISAPAQTSYNWPCIPFDQQHYINGTFCENRPNSSGSIQIDHFHDGVDIHLPQGNNVYSVINGSVTSLGYASTYGINAFVRVGRYAVVHVDPSPAVQVGSPVTAYQTVLGTTNSWNHIHFKDGYAGYETDAIRSDGGLTPLNDTFPPYVGSVAFFINGTTTRFSNNRVSGPVEIVAQASDKTDNGPLGSNNGIHAIGFQIYDATGTTALTDSIQNFKFTQIPSSDSYVTNVFFQGSDISNYLYTLTNQVTRDGYWDTRSYDPGNYQIKIFTDDSNMNSAEKWVTVEVVTQDVFPPANPELLTLTGNDNNQWSLDWLPNDSADVGGYKLYFSYSGNEWLYQPDISDQISADDTVLHWDGFGNNETIYFRLQAYDQAAIPNSSDLTDAYGVRLSDRGPDVLIVDGFDRMDGYWNESAHEYAVIYGRILSELNLAFNSCSDDAVIQGHVLLTDYQTVIYFTGDQSGTNPALSGEEQAVLAEYLLAGGNLIISGSEIGNDLVRHGNPVDSLFFSEYLKSHFISDSSESNSVEGTDESPLAGLIAEFSAPAAKTLKADVISPNGGQIWLKFADGQAAAIHFTGLFGQSNTEANLVYFTFPFELITDNDTQKLMLTRIFEAFGISTRIIAVHNSNSPAEFILYDNFPNPFNPRTHIRFRLPAAQQVLLEVFALDGQKVRVLNDKYLAAGEHTIAWDGTDSAGRLVSSGVYVYRLHTSTFDKSRKMVLLR